MIYDFMFMEIQGLWDVVVFGKTLHGFVLVRQSLSIETYATKIIQ